MPKFTIFGLLFLLLFFLHGCGFDDSGPVIDHSNSPGVIVHQPYSFFVAGHSYGAPFGTWPDTIGLYEPFHLALSDLAGNPQIKMGFLTGDIVRKNTPAYWDTLSHELNIFDVPIYAAPGNHDLLPETSPQGFDQMFGARAQYFFYEGDLFLIFNTVEFGWNIPGEQLLMMRAAMVEEQDIHNVFVLQHNISWHDPDSTSRFNAAVPNSLYGRNAQNQTFFSEVIPLFESMGKPTYFFAGDAGANCLGGELAYYSDANYHLISSGMGCHKYSHYLVVSVDADKSVHISIEELGSEMMGELEDWRF